MSVTAGKLDTGARNSAWNETVDRGPVPVFAAHGLDGPIADLDRQFE
jgi:hypothetical protein